MDAADRAAAPLAAHRPELDATLREAPRTLLEADRFLARLRTTAEPLGRVARRLTQTAQPLRTTLDALPSFTRSAVPTLDATTRVAPVLAALGRRATPDVRRLTPAVASLRRLSTSLAPVSRTLDHSAANAFAILENWARAIQFRDGLGHVFRGEASFTADAIRTATDRLLGDPRAAKPRARRRPSRAPTIPTRSVRPGQHGGSAETDRPAADALDDALGLVGSVIDTTANSKPVADVNNLLDYLLTP
jgi:hypothetical protein